jgi:hypothetical protein
MENGKWKMENGKWEMENGKWKESVVVPTPRCQAALAGLSFSIVRFPMSVFHCLLIV